MTSRERILAALARQPSDRVPMWDLTIWPETLERWHREGLPPDVDLVDYFGLDRCCCINDLFDPSFGLLPQITEETAEYRIYIDRYGKTLQEWRSASGAPRLIAPSIRNAADWQRLKPALTPTAGKFNNPAAEAEYRHAATGGHFSAITPAEPLWFVLEHCMGFELGLPAMLKQRDLVADMLATYTDYLLALLEMSLARGYRFDALWFWSDLCYKSGLVASPRLLRDLVLPHWQRLGRFAHDHGMRFIFHCDGYVGQLIPLLLEAGLDAIHPLEARAGNDVRQYKPQIGDRLCLIGNIDADVIAANDPAQIEAEVRSKIPLASAGGGYIYHIDHSVPPTISLASYRHLLDCVHKWGQPPIF